MVMRNQFPKVVMGIAMIESVSGSVYLAGSAAQAMPSGEISLAMDSAG